MKNKIPFKIVLTARQFGLYKAFQEYFSDVENICISDKDIMSVLGVNAVVSPANSYGWMDGGIDQVYVYSFGKQIEERVQERIKNEYDGELPVGEAFVIETHHELMEYLIVAPTMRIPGPVTNTQNAYLAMKAILHAVQDFNCENQNAIVGAGCPGLATGTGRMPFREAAKQMFMAYEENVCYK